MGYYDPPLEASQQDFDDDEELQQVLEEVGYPDFYNIDPFKEVRSMTYNDAKDESSDDIVGPLAAIELGRDTGDNFPEYMDDWQFIENPRNYNSDIDSADMQPALKKPKLELKEIAYSHEDEMELYCHEILSPQSNISNEAEVVMVNKVKLESIQEEKCCRYCCCYRCKCEERCHYFCDNGFMIYGSDHQCMCAFVKEH